MKVKNVKRALMIGIRLTPEEYAELVERRKASTFRRLSEYARACLFSRPIVATYRNQSMDDLMIQAIGLKKELNTILKDFNQTAEQFPSIDQLTEFRSWQLIYEIDKKKLFNKVEDTKKFLQKVAESWLQ